MPMTLAVAAVVGLLFGAGDQYLGSLTAATALGFWTTSVSALSAPWLILPFLTGGTQRRPRRAAVVGLVVTLAALAGYFAMTLSPMEGVHVHASEVRGLLVSNRLNEVGGLVTGPVFGWLGYRWRTRRSWLAAALVAGALCLEPLAVAAAGRGAGASKVVWALEVVTGLVAGVLFVAAARGHRRELV